MVDDILIRGGTVIDGTGAPARAADVAICDGRIAAIEPGRTDSATRVIDAQDRVVAPGFIDIHTHSDFTLPLNPKAECKIRQGVTTEVVGNCGFSVAPALPGKVDMLRDYLSGSAPWLDFEETDFAGYMDAWPDIAVNTVMQVGHNTLRLMAMGMENRAPKDDELRQMQDLLAEGLEAGALGLSSGLFTAPGCFSERDELRALGRVLKAARRTLFLAYPRRIARSARGGGRGDRHRRALRRARPGRAHEALGHRRLGPGGPAAPDARRRARPRRRRARRPVSLRLGDQPAALPAADLAAGGRHGGDAEAARRSLHALPHPPEDRRGRLQQLRPDRILGRHPHRHLAARRGRAGPDDRGDRAASAAAIRSTPSATSSSPTRGRRAS